MAKKRATPKPKHGSDKPVKSEDTTVNLYIPAALYDTLHKDNTAEFRDGLIRAAFHLTQAPSKVFGMDKIRIISKGLQNPKSDDDSSDDGGYPIKLCEEEGPP
jgi:hypothetical protein